MARDSSRFVRQATIAALKQVTTGVADRWYPQQVPANPVFPYGFVGVPISSPDRADCLDGSVIRFAIHAYTRTTATSGETQANIIGEDIADALDGERVDLPTAYPAAAEYTWISNTVVRDPSEASMFHLISQWEVEVSS